MKKWPGLKDKQKMNLLKKPNVIGVGYGLKETAGETTGQPAVLVFVTKKVPRAQLSSRAVVPQAVENCAVDVMEIGEVRLLEDDKERAGFSGYTNLNRLIRYRPVPAGVSIGHYKVSAGTVGAVVRHKKSGRLAILSNNHVLANSSSGKDGRAKTGDPVLQPGALDGGSLKRDRIGWLGHYIALERYYQQAACNVARFWERGANRLLSSFMPRYRVKFERLSEHGNLVDAALAFPEQEKDIRPEILGLGRVKGTAAAVVGKEIVFSGRTSGVVSGRVIATDVSLFVGVNPGEEGFFVDQILISAVSRPGDSGSLVMDRDNRAVGLLFAGSERVSVCNRIEHVTRLLDIEIV